MKKILYVFGVMGLFAQSESDAMRVGDDMQQTKLANKQAQLPNMWGNVAPGTLVPGVQPEGVAARPVFPLIGMELWPAVVQPAILVANPLSLLPAIAPRPGLQTGSLVARSLFPFPNVTPRPGIQPEDQPEKGATRGVFQ